MLFDFIKSLIPNVKKSSLIDDLENAQRNYREVAIPTAYTARDTLRLFDKHPPVFQHANDIFYGSVNLRRGKYFLDDFVRLVEYAAENTDFVLKQVQKVLEDNTLTDVIDVPKAQLIRSAAGLSHLGDMVPIAMNTLAMAQSQSESGDGAMTKAEQEKFLQDFRRLMSLISAYAREPKQFQKQLLAVPEARITPDNMNQVQAMHLKDLDPFSEAEANGFVPHPVLLIREQWANFQIWRYERNKTLKKTFELRVRMLETQKAGENTAAIESQIEYYQNQVEKLNDKIGAFETKYGR